MDMVKQLLFFLDYSLLVESPRWLYAVGRTSEANAVVKKIAKINRRQLPHNLNISVVVSQILKPLSEGRVLQVVLSDINGNKQLLRETVTL